MLQTSARLLRLLSLLQARQGWTGTDLVGRLEVTDRTLRRDVDRLRTLGYPVHSTSGPAGGYSLGAGASLPPLMLEDDEGIAIALRLQTAAGGSVAGIEDASQRALMKLEKVLPARLRRRLRALRSSIVRLDDMGPAVGLQAVAALAAACSDNQEASFGYRDRGGVATERSVEPHRLVHVDRRWYLVAWDKKREDWRTFRVDRIELPIGTGEPFTPRSAPEDDLAAYVSRSISTAPYRHRARVILEAPIDVMKQQISTSTGHLEAIDARRCRLQIGANTLEGIALHLGRLGVEFEVEHPPELVERVREIGARLTRAAAKIPSNKRKLSA